MDSRGMSRAHEAGSPYKRGGPPSPPLAGTRGYPYPQDPTRTHFSPLLNSGQQSYRDAFQGSKVPTSSAAMVQHHFLGLQLQAERQQEYLLERYREPEPQHVRRRPSLLPAPEYGAADRDRYLESYRFPAYGGEMGMVAAAPADVVDVHVNKRPRLGLDPKAPLVIDTAQDAVEVKKEPAYVPQVEAISPTLPGEDGHLSPQRSSKDELLNAINKLDREIAQVESQTGKLKKKQQELEASSPADNKKYSQDAAPSEPKQLSVAQVVYSENRKKAQQAHATLDNLGPKVDLPMYNQPSDTATYHENKKRFQEFRKTLTVYLKKRVQERETREKYLMDTYGQLMQAWLKKMEKRENNAARKLKEQKQREFFEKQFPELKKQREDRERFSRAGQRVRSEAEMEEIMDGLQEQENEDRKMRSYAVVPPILLDSRQRHVHYVNKNSVVEDLSAEYKERQMQNVWSDQEKEIFREKYLQHPKNFGIIASYLERKNVADCVQYYYLTKKGENYKQLLRKHNVKKRTRAMVKAPVPATTTVGLLRDGVSDDVPPRGDRGRYGRVPPALQVAATLPVRNPASVSGAEEKVGTSGVSTAAAAEATADATVASTDPRSDGPAAEERPRIVDTLNGLKNVPEKPREAGTTPSESGQALDLRAGEDPERRDGPPADEERPCSVCRCKLERNGQSRPLTKANCETYALKESDVTPDARVCSSCRFKTVRQRFVQCPIPTCKTPKRKVKRLRPLPGKLNELDADAREAVVQELQIPSGIQKCCSACFNRIARKLEPNAPSEDPVEPSRWSEEEMDLAKKCLREYGTDWPALASVVKTKTKEQCKNFYFNYKRKLGLEELVRAFREAAKEDGKRQVTDDDESGETTTSCEEDDCADRCSSDTASACSPAAKQLEEGWDCNKPPPPPPVSAGGPSGGRPSDNGVEALADYDSSATVSADEGQGGSHETEGTTPRALDPRADGGKEAGRDGPTCMRDLIFQAIEMTLQHSMKPGRPGTSQDAKEERTEGAASGAGPPVGPAGRGSPGYGAPSPSVDSLARPEGLVAQFPRVPREEDYEVQDLSKKPREASPSREVRREKVLAPLQSAYHQGQFGGGQPPPAHSNRFRHAPDPPQGAYPPGRPPPHLVPAWGPAKGPVPPPPPLVAVAGKPPSPKLVYKEKASHSGSITQGTPVPGFGPRYEGLLRQMAHGKESGSITLGTPVHDAHPGKPRLEQGDTRGYEEQYYRVPPFQGSFPGYQPPFRPKYSSESQLSTNQIVIDFNTSKQMQMRRGSSESSPRDPGPASAAYQASGGWPSQGPAFLPGAPPPERGPADGAWNPVRPRQNVIRSVPWGPAPKSVIQVPKSSSPRERESSPGKRGQSPRAPYPVASPSSHDPFTTLVNAAAAQPSLAVPKEDKKLPAVEGLEKSLLEMHQRPRSYQDMPPPDGYAERPPLRATRESFSREQFEREMRAVRKEEVRGAPYLNRAQQAELDNEASRIFSQSFQKDSPKTSSSPQGITAANLIDAIITHQINQNTDPRHADGIPSRYEGKARPPRDEDDAPRERRADVPQPEKVVTLNQHIAAVISKNICQPNEAYGRAPAEGAPRTSSCYDGDGGARHGYNWKLRKALQQPEAKEEQRQVIRGSQGVPYAAVEPISPPADRDWTPPRAAQHVAGLSPLDYVKNRIVEVMRTADDIPVKGRKGDDGEPRPPSGGAALPPRPASAIEAPRPEWRGGKFRPRSVSPSGLKPGEGGPPQRWEGTTAEPRGFYPFPATYAYPFSALSVRSAAGAPPAPPVSAAQPPPSLLLSSQYEPLSDED